jgi:hypothetical protein
MPFPLEGRRAFAVLLAALAVLLLAAGLSRAADPQFNVTNRLPQTFVVVNRVPAAPCSICSPCACKAGVCPACPAAKPVHVSPDGTVNELGADGIYRPVPGAPKRTPVAQPSPAFAAPVLDRFAPSFAPYCPPGARG